MLYWLIIILGIVFLSSLSAILYLITFKKNIKFNMLFNNIITRVIIIFLLGIIIIFFGLYVESIS